MPRAFSPATAEQVVAAVEAVFVNGKPTNASFVAAFCDLPSDRADAALELAVDLSLLSKQAGEYRIANPLCRVLGSPDERHRAAALRVALESYEPFIVFRERLPATPMVATAAHQTKSALDLDAHRDEIKDTLISLGTYSQALMEAGGGRYRLAEPSTDHLLDLAVAAQALAAAESRIRQQIGETAAGRVSRDEVLLPLADGLQKAAAADAEGAVQAAGNAVESYLVEVAGRVGANLAGATGLNAKVERLVTHGTIPKKVAQIGKYLGHIRNAADHGIDADVGASWTIRPSTGIEYVFVACSFIAAVDLRERGGPVEL